MTTYNPSAASYTYDQGTHVPSPGVTVTIFDAITGGNQLTTTPAAVTSDTSGNLPSFTIQEPLLVVYAQAPTVGGVTPKRVALVATDIGSVILTEVQRSTAVDTAVQATQTAQASTLAAAQAATAAEAARATAAEAATAQTAAMGTANEAAARQAATTANANLITAEQTARAAADTAEANTRAAADAATASLDAAQAVAIAGKGQAVSYSALLTGPQTVPANTVNRVDTTGGPALQTFVSAPPDGTIAGVMLVASTATPTAATYAAGSGDTLDPSLSGSVAGVGELVEAQYQASTKVWRPAPGRLPLAFLRTQFDAAGAATTAVAGVTPLSIGAAPAVTTSAKSFSPSKTSPTTFTYGQVVTNPYGQVVQCLATHTVSVVQANLNGFAAGYDASKWSVLGDVPRVRQPVVFLGSFTFNSPGSGGTAATNWGEAVYYGRQGGGTTRVINTSPFPMTIGLQPLNADGTVNFNTPTGTIPLGAAGTPTSEYVSSGYTGSLWVRATNVTAPAKVLFRDEVAA